VGLEPTTWRLQVGGTLSRVVAGLPTVSRFGCSDGQTGRSGGTTWDTVGRFGTALLGRLLGRAQLRRGPPTAMPEQSC
jgi:hypothetical protein